MQSGIPKREKKSLITRIHQLPTNTRRTQIPPKTSGTQVSEKKSKTHHSPLKAHERERRLLERKRTLSKERQASKTPEKKVRLPSSSPPRPFLGRDFKSDPLTLVRNEEEPSPKTITVTITLPPTKVNPKPKQGAFVSPIRYYHVQYGGWTFEMHAMKKQVEALESKLNQQEPLSDLARYGFKKQLKIEKAKLNREIRRLQTEAVRKL